MSFLQVQKVGQDACHTCTPRCCNSSKRLQTCNNNNEEKDKKDPPEEGSLISGIATVAQEGLNILVRPFSKISCKLSEAANALFNAFSPFLDFVNLTDSNKKTVKDLSQILLESKTKLDNDKSFNVSNKTKEAINRLYESLSKVTQREDLQSVDVTELIRRWRQDPQSRVLFELAERLQNGQCAPFQDRRYKEALIRSLRVLAEGLDEISRQPQSPQSEAATQEIIQAANPIVDTVQLHQARWGDANFTSADRRQVAENFSICREHLGNVVNDPNLASVLRNVRDAFSDLINHISSFIETWHRDYEQEQKEEKTRLSQLCEERDQVKEQIRVILARLQKKTQEKIRYKTLAEEKWKEFCYYKLLKQKILEILGTRNKNYNRAAFKLNESKANYLRAENSRVLFSKETHSYEHIKQEILDLLLPSYICDKTGNNLELDLFG